MIEKLYNFRPGKQPRDTVPLGVRNVGHFILEAGDTYKETTKFPRLYWCVKGGGRISMKGKEVDFSAEQLAVCEPRPEQHRLTSLDSEWEIRFCTFDGHLVKDLLSHAGLKIGVYNVEFSPISILDQIGASILHHGLHAEKLCSGWGYQLMTQGYESPKLKKRDSFMDEVLKEMDESWCSKELSLGSLAKKFRVHRTTLTRRFRQAMNTTPIEYILDLRIQNAKILLKETSKSIGEIATYCGFEDPNYFSRIFKSKTGITAKLYRAS